MKNPKSMTKKDRIALAAAVDHAVRAIPPVWPLSSSVAVNPFLGQASQDLASTSAILGRAAGISLTMPRAWYGSQIKAGSISDDDIQAALQSASHASGDMDLARVKAALTEEPAAPDPVPTLADLAGDITQDDWLALIEDRFGVWAAGYFDAGQALWAAPRGNGAYSAWREWASRDLTPEIAGLHGFCALVTETPQTAEEAIVSAVGELGLKPAELPTYFHRLLMMLGGWVQVGRYRLWQAELAQGEDSTLADLLAIRLVFEQALHGRFGEQISDAWETARAAYGTPIVPTSNQAADAILQEAAERAAQRRLAAVMSEPAANAASARPALQAAFCIDVRSEVFRRALEGLNPDIETIGFAGFFGLAASHKRFASDVEEFRLPVLLNPGVHSCSGGSDEKEADLARRYTARAKRAWGRFKLAAVSSFAFVEAMGPVYIAKLLGDSLRFSRKGAPDDPAPRLAPELSLNERVGAARTILSAMSLTKNFAHIVLIAGHGANVVNNPHASALHCGACGGYSGEVNARLLAGLLNDDQVREGLKTEGIDIPADTLFVAGLHDTTTDALTLYDIDGISGEPKVRIAQVHRWLKDAARTTNAERALRLPRAEDGGSISARSRDWSEVRPEWALAGCQAFIAAPRKRTLGKSLQGRAFLHDYDWRQDKAFPVLELIMTAPVVVASWISLQYFGSVVAPSVFGGGNKLLHNVVGGIGVLEGNGGSLRAGLPWQSVHDGENLIHEPLRLSVCIEAPVEAMSDILSRHEGVRALFDNRWLHLFALDADGKMAWRYAGDLKWKAFEESGDAGSAQANVA